MNYCDAVRAIECRARRLRGTAVGSRLLLGTGGAAALAGLLVRLLAGAEAARGPLVAALAVVPIGIAAVGYALVARRPVRVGPILLRVDFALGLDARLSSLHELAKTRPGSFLFGRLEKEVAASLVEWRKALPVSRRSLAALAVGVASIAAAIVLIAVAGPLENSAGDVAYTPAAGEGTTAAAERSEASGESGETAAGLAVDADPQAGPEATEYRLDDVLADLGLAAGSAEDSGGIPGAVEVDELRGEGQSLEELIAEARARVRRDEEPLTVEEQEALRAAAITAAAPVRRALEDVLAASTATESLDALDALSASLELSRTFSEEPSNGSSRVPTEQEEVDGSESVAGEALLATPEDDSGGGLPPFNGLAKPEDESARAGTEIAEGTEPGDEGAPVPVDVGPESAQPAGFVLERTPTGVGETGEVKSYLTVGVPLEFEQEGSDAVSARVSFDRIESIVTSREISPEVAETVRKYFESITEGGT